MSQTPFQKDKIKTPDDWQAIYMTDYKRQLRRVLPWAMLVPAVLLCPMTYYFAPGWRELSFTQIAMLFLVYVVLVAGICMAFGIKRPRHDEGEVTRRILDAARKRNE